MPGEIGCNVELVTMYYTERRRDSVSNEEVSDERVEKRCTTRVELGTRDREKRIFVMAPIELLKMLIVVVLFSFIEHIRSLGFLTANSSKVPTLLTS